MYGNVYAYYVPYTQQKVIDISKFQNVHSIDVYFYQDYNFADGNNQTISYEEYDSVTGVPAVPENIIFDNTQFYLGVSAEDIKAEKTYLYSYDPYTYTGIETKIGKDEFGTQISTYTCETSQELLFAWIHYEDNGTYSVIDNLDKLMLQAENSDRDTNVFWYRYSYNDEIAGTIESLFPGQQYIEQDGQIVPIVQDGEPLFADGCEKYKELYVDLMHSKQNPDYTSRMERYAGSGWTLIPAATDCFSYTITPRGNKSREKFKVVVQHHGTHTVSDELILTNTRDIEAELEANAKNDAVVIKCFKLVKIRDDKNNWLGTYEAVENGSINAFHVYDENNKILINDDDERFDEHYYYLQIQSRNEDTNKYEILKTFAENGLASGTTISWAFPRNYTMIKSTEEVNATDAAYFYITDTDSLEYKNFHNATIKFKIKSIYDNRSLDNIVGALIIRNNNKNHIEKNLMFGRADGFGHEFLPIMEIIYPAGGSYICQGHEFEIGCVVYNKDGSLFDAPSTLTFQWRELSPEWLSDDGAQKFYHNTIDENGEPIQKEGYEIGTYDFNNNDNGLKNKYAGYKNNIVRGYIHSQCPYPPIFEVTVYGAADYPLTIRKGFLMCDNFEYMQSRDIFVPSRVEFKSDGANPIYYNDVFKVERLTSEANSLIATYDIEHPKWEIDNNNPNFYLEPITIARTAIERQEDGYLGSVHHDYTDYKLKFKTEGNPQWRDELLDPENYTYIYYNLDVGENNELSIYVAQSIAFARNYYSSSLVNEWDGASLTWDEENGAILSTMIAAGSKDGNNKFTGVMMGEWSSKGDESLDTPGMYGYHQGEQSFAFKTDGTGFIGKSGKGRIEFDGTEALITNADRTCYINLNPMLKTIIGENEQIDFNSSTNQSFSENFLFAKVPRAINNYTSATSSILGEDSWVREYFEDADNDYFVVNPNYGVLTTGGVIARYGALGNWKISNEGLYQKSNGAYMYLGFDEVDIGYKNILYTYIKSAESIKLNLKNLYNTLGVPCYNDENILTESSTGQYKTLYNFENIKRNKENEKNHKDAEYETFLENNENIVQDNNNKINAANDLINKNIERIAALTADNAEKQAEIDEIEKEISEKVKEKNGYEDEKKGEQAILTQLCNDYKKEHTNMGRDMKTINDAFESNIAIYNNATNLYNTKVEYNSIYESSSNQTMYSNKEIIDKYIENLAKQNENATLIDEQKEIINNSSNSAEAISTAKDRLAELEADETNLLKDEKTLSIILTVYFNQLTDYETKFNLINDICIEYEKKYDEIEDVPEYPVTEDSVNTTYIHIADRAISKFELLEQKYDNLSGRLSDIKTVQEELNKENQEISDNEIHEILKEQSPYKEHYERLCELNVLIDECDAAINDQDSKNAIAANEEAIEENISEINKCQQSNIDQNNIITMSQENIDKYYSDKASYENIINTLSIDIDKYNGYIITAKKDISDTLNEIKNIIFNFSINEKNFIVNIEELRDTHKDDSINDYIEQADNITGDTYESIIGIFISAVNNLLLKFTTRYAIYVADKDPDLMENLNENPYFSVDWNGSMFARKGIIANTWIIDDSSLTYKIKNDKIYFGQGDKNSGKVYGYDENDNKIIIYPLSEQDQKAHPGWAISAGQEVDEDYHIRFGVTINGQLYSEFGRIGGWDITKESLSSIPTGENTNSIILDSKNNQIRFSNNAFILDGDTATLFLGQQIETGSSEKVTRGNVYLANFLLSGNSTGEPVAYKDKTTYYDSGQQNEITLKGDSYEYGWNGINIEVESPTVSVKSNALITNLDFQLMDNKTNYLQFIDKTYSSGMVLASGIMQKENPDIQKDVKTLLYPVQDGSILGASDHRWNIVAENITASQVGASVLYGDDIYMSEDKAGDLDLVATQKWVNRILQKVWDALNGIANDAGNASRTSHAKAIVAADWGGAISGNGSYQIYMIFTRGNGSTFNSSSTGELAGGAHGHNTTVVRDGTNIKVDVKSGSCTWSASSTGVSIDHSHDIEFKISSGGEITGTVSGANFSKATGTGSFNVKNTQWYKDEMDKAYKAAVDKCSKSITWDANNISGSNTTATASVEVRVTIPSGTYWNQDTDSVTGSWSDSTSISGAGTKSYSGSTSGTVTCNTEHTGSHSFTAKLDYSGSVNVSMSDLDLSWSK